MNPFQPEATNVDQSDLKRSGAAGGDGSADGQLAKHPVEQQMKTTSEHAELAWESLAAPGPGEGEASK